MHGGAAGSGAPRGNRNALKHGLFTQENRSEQKKIRALLQMSSKLLLEID
jgi:glucans biosynthesis protein